MEFTGKSPIQYTQGENGTWAVSVPGIAVTAVETVVDDEPVFDWLAVLDIPKDWDKIAAMAVPNGDAPCWIRFIACDESITKLTGAVHLQPARMTFKPSGQLLTLAHLGYAIGICRELRFGLPNEVTNVEGSFIMGEAQLYKSSLADAAWRGIKEGIFQHVSAIVVRPSNEPPGVGCLVEIGVVDRPGCQNARILKAWEEHGSDFA